MKKLTVAGCLAVFSLFLPSRCPAVPIDVPYITQISTTATGSVVLSTTNFANVNVSANANIANYQWCITHLVVSGNLSQDTLTMAWSTATLTTPLTSGTTDYRVVITSAVPFYDEKWPYRQPYCSPIGQTILTITSSVAAATLQIEGYLFKGWGGGI